MWKSGPDNGVLFWSGRSATAIPPGGAVNGAFSAWAPGEPNDWTDNDFPLGEDCAVINKYVAGSGNTPTVFSQELWDDLPCRCTNVAGYLAEFGNKSTGGDYANVDFGTSTMSVAVPAAKPTFLDRLFNLVGFKKTVLPKGFKIKIFKPKTKKAPASVQTCPGGIGRGKTRFSYTLLFTEAGRYSFYFTTSTGKRIPMQCGTKIKTRMITEPISAPVIQSVKDNERPVITAYLKTSEVGGVMDYPLLNVILKRTDGTLIRQDQPNPPLAGTPIK